MKFFISTLLLLHIGFASTILSYKVYERPERVDLLFTFDTPYEGRISQQNSENTTLLILEGATYDASIAREFDSLFLKKLSIKPQTNRTTLELYLTPQTKYDVSKTVDNYGLRLRFEAKPSKVEEKFATSSTASLLGTRTEPKTLSTLPTQKESQTGNMRYFIVVGFLLVIVISLFVFKRKMEAKNGTGGWLFKDKNIHNIEKVKIIFQKPLDNQNKVVMMEFGARQYLVIVGQSHLLLDIFSEDASVRDEEGFNDLLKRNQQELDKYMQLNTPKPDPLQSLKEKASQQAYRFQQDNED